MDAKDHAKSLELNPIKHRIYTFPMVSPKETKSFLVASTEITCDYRTQILGNKLPESMSSKLGHRHNPVT